MKTTPRIHPAVSWTCPLLLVALTACTAPPAEPAASAAPPAPFTTRDIRLHGPVEFLHPQRIVAVQELEGGGAVISFERSARYFCIPPARLPDHAAMTVLARSLMESGKPVYATAAVESPVAIGELGPFPPLIRIALTPDPRASG